MKKYILAEVPEWCNSVELTMFKGSHPVDDRIVHGKRALLEKAFEVLGDVGAVHDRPGKGEPFLTAADGKLTLVEAAFGYESVWPVLTNLDDDEPGEWEEWEKTPRTVITSGDIINAINRLKKEIDELKRCPRGGSELGVVPGKSKRAETSAPSRVRGG